MLLPISIGLKLSVLPYMALAPPDSWAIVVMLCSTSMGPILVVVYMMIVSHELQPGCSLWAPPFSYSYIEEKTSCLVFLHRPIVDALLTLIWHPPFTRRCCANTSATFPSQPKAVLLQHNCMPDVCCVRKIFIVQLPLSDVGDCTFTGGLISYAWPLLLG